MRTFQGSTAIQRDFALAVPLCAVAWLFTAPNVPTGYLLALAGVVLASGWTVRAYLNDEPARKLVPLLDRGGKGRSLEHPRSDR